ncbi:hypothetical protein OROMI_004893 [Orobanche minor]
MMEKGRSRGATEQPGRPVFFFFFLASSTEIRNDDWCLLPINSAKWKRHMELMYILAYDLLFGQEFPSIGDAETYLMLKKDALRSALSRILSCKGVKNVEDLMALVTFTEFRKPRYVRVNTIKIDAEYAIRELRQEYEVIDASSAPGNKTVHLASLMKGKGKIVACELDEERVKLLKHIVELAGAKSILYISSCPPSICISKYNMSS